MTHEVHVALSAAIHRDGKPSSDFDLNPDVVLPETRVLKPASVLVPIISKESGLQVILTKRSSALKHHPGQISFPGGKVDPGDADVFAAALREANEEIGLKAEQADVLGTLPDHETVTGFSVTPVLALIDASFIPAREVGEVEEVFEVPLNHVMDEHQYSVQYRRWRGQRRLYFTVPWGPYYIWGATARILRALADRMTDDTH